MTLLVLVQGPGGMRHSPEGWSENAEKAKGRRWSKPGQQPNDTSEGKGSSAVADKRTEKAITDEGGRVVGRVPHSIYTCAHPNKGPGYPIRCYLPMEPKKKARWFQYSCTPLHGYHEPTFSAILHEKKHRTTPTCLEARIT